ncbi:MAG TPA: hypothetical protein VK619_12530 [Pyrinomonadaceae bacterium]|nr:hypothetical protein [Pyrinomonadaceae bacterium]
MAKGLGLFPFTIHYFLFTKLTGKEIAGVMYGIVVMHRNATVRSRLASNSRVSSIDNFGAIENSFDEKKHARQTFVTLVTFKRLVESLS